MSQSAAVSALMLLAVASAAPFQFKQKSDGAIPADQLLQALQASLQARHAEELRQEGVPSLGDLIKADQERRAAEATQPETPKKSASSLPLSQLFGNMKNEDFEVEFKKERRQATGIFPKLPHEEHPDVFHAPDAHEIHMLRSLQAMRRKELEEEQESARQTMAKRLQEDLASSFQAPKMDPDSLLQNDFKFKMNSDGGL